MVAAPGTAIDKVVSSLKDGWKVDWIAPGHCTGEPTFAALRQAFGDHYLYAGLGTVLVFGASPHVLAADSSGLRRAGTDRQSYRGLLARSDDRQH